MVLAIVFHWACIPKISKSFKITAEHAPVEVFFLVMFSQKTLLSLYSLFITCVRASVAAHGLIRSLANSLFFRVCWNILSSAWAVAHL